MKHGNEPDGRLRPLRLIASALSAMEKRPPLSIILAAIWLALGCISGIFEVLDLDLVSIEGLVFISLYVLTAYTLYALFCDRNTGRILAAVQLSVFGLIGALAAIVLSMSGASLPVLVVNILIATFQLSLAWQLFFGEPAREYANVVANESRT